MNTLHPDTLHHLHTARTVELTGHIPHNALPPFRKPRNTPWSTLRRRLRPAV
jgi:hypothetical protein